MNNLLNLGATHLSLGWMAVGLFILGYALVILEEFTHLRKSKPMLVCGAIIWVLVSLSAQKLGVEGSKIEYAIKHTLLEYAELLLFLMVAMVYVNSLEKANVFLALKSWLSQHRFSYRSLFWLTGFCAFFLSPIADNMTTALVMGAIIVSVGLHHPKFVSLGCVNIVIAANAGGAFSPFGDITTLMVWQKGVLSFGEFFKLFLPSLVNFLIPAICMHPFLPKGIPTKVNETHRLLKGAKVKIILFLSTIFTTVFLHHFFHLPPVVGMMLGLSYLLIYGYFLKKKDNDLDIFTRFQTIEWDTLLFFYGIMLAVGGLATFGYLEIVSHHLYTEWGMNLIDWNRQTPANVTLGMLSALIDNIPLMFAILTMNPDMSQGQWLLITLTTGVGGSLLSIGSAAGVALMGQARGRYTFFSHLKWSWAILLGYIASILVHFWINKASFYV